MAFIIKLLITAVAVLISAYILPGVYVNSFLTAIVVAAVLGLFNAILKPLLIILTIPITILTLGLFLLVINAIIILLTDFFISGFEVSGFLWALVFSIILSIITYVFDAIIGNRV
ncbi:MAG: phage holin family protein [Bacteroidota bacterium]|nr:phage holin family protein [Bacteroidota bacterium]